MDVCLRKNLQRSQERPRGGTSPGASEDQGAGGEVCLEWTEGSVWKWLWGQTQARSSDTSKPWQRLEFVL